MNETSRRVLGTGLLLGGNRLSRLYLLWAVAFAAAFCMVWIAYAAVPAQGATGVPPAFQDTLVAGGLSSPTSMALAPGGRIFVTQKSGELRSRPFLKVNPNAEGERGLLGVALDPGFRKNGYVYVYYTARTPKIHNRISRFTAVRTASGGGATLPRPVVIGLSST